MNFRIKEKLMLWISGSKKNLFQRNKLAQRWSFHSIYEAWAAHEMRKGVVQLYIKNNEVIFSLAWNIIFSDNWKVLVLKFLEMKNMVFLSQKVDGNMIFTDYWKVLVLIFSEMGNTVFSWAQNWLKDDIYWLLKRSCFELFGHGKYGLFWVKKLMERWYLLVTEKFVFWTFWWWETQSFFSAKKLMKRWYLHGLFELSMIFQDLRNIVFRAVLIIILRMMIKMLIVLNIMIEMILIIMLMMMI